MFIYILVFFCLLDNKSFIYFPTQFCENEENFIFYIKIFKIHDIYKKDKLFNFSSFYVTQVPNFVKIKKYNNHE